MGTGSRARVDAEDTAVAVEEDSTLEYKGFGTSRSPRSPAAAGVFSYLWNLIRVFLIRLSTMPRDVRALKRYIQLLLIIRRAKKYNLNVPKIFLENVRKHPNKVAFYFEDQKWTFADVDEYSNRVGNFFSKEGLKRGDAIALFMENRVEYICMWLGLSKIGVTPALINYNLRDNPLKHSITIAESKAIVCGAELVDAVSGIYSELGDMPVYVSGAGSGELQQSDWKNLDVSLHSADTSIPPELESVNFSDKLVYIYTSGTTGLPKAAVIKHSRALFAVYGMGKLVNVGSKDVLYDPLPLYHTVGGAVGVGMALVEGGTVAIRKKFSVTHFWSDCAKYECTAAQYIGEICRYLLNTPPRPEDTKHNVKVMFGNGLRPQIWHQFQKRFNIERISEFYGATEGNANIINMDGKPGAVGFVSVLFPSVYPCALIKVDDATGEPLRNENGLCYRCQPGEPGEFVGKIIVNDPVRDFHGYADKTATKKKIASDVFVKGDSYFLSGDILVMDEEGYLYFKDRTGDTFRWKGENVSTSEVEGVISKVAGLTDAVVYGVEIPGAEGRAGMVAILDPDGKLNMEELASGMKKSLPTYARPLFVRIVSKLDITGTYKLKKVDLQKEGYDMTRISDKLFFLDTKSWSYTLMTKELYDNLTTGQVRL